MTDDLDPTGSTHMIRTTLTLAGKARKRAGVWHLSTFGPVTLCGEPIELSTTHRLDLTRARLIGPDVCVECVGIYDPDAAREAQRQADSGDDDQGDDGDQLGGQSLPAADTADKGA